MARLGPHRLWGYSFDAKLEYLSSSMVHSNSDKAQKMALPHYYVPNQNKVFLSYTMDFDQRN